MVAKAKLTDEQNDEIRRRKAADPTITNAAFAREYNVDPSTISRVLSKPAEPVDQAAAADVQTPSTAAPHNRLHPSPLNPRKRFDPDAVADLSESVEREGVLMQLLVRHANRPGNSPVAGAGEGDFEIIAGERRWRAAGQVISRGAWAADAPLPIRLIDPCDDRKMLELALTENVARKDMTPIEEAEAFANLAAEGATPAEIGKVVGLTTRTVQKRLRLIKDLTPKVRAALAEGDISVEFANVLAAYCPKSRQDATLDEIQRGYHGTTGQLKAKCLSVTRPKKIAFFDLALYKGELIEDEEHPGIEYFSDLEQFERLQMAAVQAKAAELSKKFAWVEIADSKSSVYFYRWNYDVKKGDPAAGAVIEIEHDREVKVHTDLVKKVSTAGRGSSAQSDGPAKAEPVTKAHCIHAHQRKTAAMQEAVAAAPMMAMRLVCAALLGARDACRIETPEIREYRHSSAVEQQIRQFLPAFSALKNHDDKEREFSISSRGTSLYKFGCQDHAGVWNAIAGLADEAVARLFAALVAVRTGTFDDWNPTTGDDPMPLAVANTLGLVGNEARAGLWVKSEDLEGVRKETLIAFGKVEGVPGEISNLKTAALKGKIAAHAGANTVFPTLRFAPANIVNAMLAGRPHPADINRVLGTLDPAATSSSATNTGLSDIHIAICSAIKNSDAGNIVAAEVEIACNCSRDDILTLIVADVLHVDNANFLSPGPNFPSNAILASRAPIASRLGISVQQHRHDWSEVNYSSARAVLLEDVARPLRSADGTLNVTTDEDVRRALIRGINAYRGQPLDTPIAGSARFQTEDLPTHPRMLIDELFEIYGTDDEYGMDDLDDAVVVVCLKLNITPTFLKRKAAE